MMKDTTAPIKRSVALIQFSREHHFGLLLVWKIKHGIKLRIEAERIRDYAVFFYENELKDHFKEEENNLFIKLPADDAMRIQAFEEHNTIYNLVEKLRKNPVDKSLLKEFAEAVDHHIRFEERVFFRHLENHLSEEDLNKEHRKREVNIDEQWKDQFWLIKK